MDTPMDNNVTDLAKERKKRAPAEKNDGEIGKRELYSIIVEKMNGSDLQARMWPAFPRRFHVVADNAGRKNVLEETAPGMVAYRTVDVVSDAILQYAHNHLYAIPGTNLSAREAIACRDLWLGLAQPLPALPMALAELSTPGLAFKRLPFDAAVKDAHDWPSAEPPLFNDFLRRCSNGTAVAAFIGSLFYERSSRQQYLYLYGEGQDGKGALLRMLYKLMEEACQALQPRIGNDRFYNMKFYGKRLLLMTDCAEPDFFVTPDFKALTGEDPLFFEEKGRGGFTAIPSCKVIVASNIKPTISSQKSDRRRLIFSRVSPIADEAIIPHFEEELIKEAELIIRWCKLNYLQLCPTHGQIPVEPDEAGDVTPTGEEIFEKIFMKHFAADPEGWVRGDRVMEVLQQEGLKNAREIHQLKAVWERRYGITIRRKTDGNHYFGLRYEPKNYSL